MGDIGIDSGISIVVEPCAIALGTSGWLIQSNETRARKQVYRTEHYCGTLYDFGYECHIRNSCKRIT